MPSQSQIPPPQRGGGQKQVPLDVVVVKAPQIKDTLKKVDALLAKKQKLQPPECCGTLPCKGRVPACFTCRICLDCITGAGCGHNDSHHEPQSGQVLEGS